MIAHAKRGIISAQAVDVEFAAGGGLSAHALRAHGQTGDNDERQDECKQCERMSAHIVLRTRPSAIDRGRPHCSQRVPINGKARVKDNAHA
ncbi:MAG: hypothetical protein DPW22_01025 [Alphaproteobacteria bacterium]|nr:hypothetical protein [Alphaproteobacteria bacterium]